MKERPKSSEKIANVLVEFVAGIHVSRSVLPPSPEINDLARQPKTVNEWLENRNLLAGDLVAPGRTDLNDFSNPCSLEVTTTHDGLEPEHYGMPSACGYFVNETQVTGQACFWQWQMPCGPY